MLSLLGASPEGVVCVCNFVEPFGQEPAATVSHHLKILSEARFVRGDRRRKLVWRTLNRSRLAELRKTIDR